MKMANALPRVWGSEYTSANIPATTAMGALAVTPQNKRKTRRAGQLGARAQAMVKTQKTKNVASMRFLRPKCSLKGPQMIGPNT